MYDVAKIGKQGNHYVIVCESDSFEDLFIGVLKAASKAKSKMVPQIQFSQAIVGLEIKKPVLAFEKVRGIHSDFYLSFLKEIIPPPPRVF
jgi:hypothetical protein